MAKAQFRLSERVGEIVLTGPPLNLVDLELAGDLEAALAAASDSGARALLVHAEGENFCGGASVDIFLGRDEASAAVLLGRFLESIRRMEALPIPTICAVQGLCFAAGLEIALSCDLIWAAEGTQLGLLEAVIGATPFGGGTQRLVARAGSGRAAEAVLTGRPYPASVMLDWGVVNRVVDPAAELLPKARGMAERLAAGPTLAHGVTKQIIHATVERGVAGADRLLAIEGARVMASEDLQRGAASLLEHGPGRAEFNGR